MDCFRLPIPQFRRIYRLFVLVTLAAWATATPALAQRKSSRPSPSPAATQQPLTADKIGAEGSVAADYLPDPVAKVDGKTISRAEVLQIAEALLGSNNRHLQDLSATEKGQVYRSVLDQMITDRLITAQAKTETVDDVTVLRTYDNLERQYPDAAAFEAEIKKSGQTQEKIRDNIRNQIAQQQWLEKQIASDTTVTPAEVEAFYKDGPTDRFDVPEMIRASHILVALRRDAVPEDALAAENRINDLGERLKKGDKFEDLARISSDDKKSGEHGGDLGFFMKERVLPEIAEAAFKLKVGEVSPPVHSDFGYHLIKVTDRKPGHHATLDESREQITAFLTQQKRTAAVAKVVQSLREKAKIENYLS